MTNRVSILISLMASIIYSFSVFIIMALECKVLEIRRERDISSATSIFLHCIGLFLITVHAVVACAFFEFLFVVMPISNSRAYSYLWTHPSALNAAVNNDTDATSRRVTLYCSRRPSYAASMTKPSAIRWREPVHKP